MWSGPKTDKRMADSSLPSPDSVAHWNRPDDDLPEARPEQVSQRFRWLGIVASLLIVCGSGYVLWQLVREVQWWEVVSAFGRVNPIQLWFAALFTAISYGFLTAYDALALRQLRLKLPYSTSAFGSFTSYAVSFNLGFPLLTGGAVRYRVYSPKGLSAGRIASLTVIAGITFWLGMAVVLGVSLVREAEPLSHFINSREPVNYFGGIALLVGVAGYFFWVSRKRRSVSLQGWRLELPGFRLSLAQTLIGAADVCCAAAVLYVVLPANHGIGFEMFLAIYVVAVMLGIISHAPGGIGVFEATILLALSHLPREPVLGALLLFRIYYFFIPFALALLLLGFNEIWRRHGSNDSPAT
jgi:glycosyltransferase 2 family protein